MTDIVGSVRYLATVTDRPGRRSRAAGTPPESRAGQVPPIGAPGNDLVGLTQPLVAIEPLLAISSIVTFLSVLVFAAVVFSKAEATVRPR
jgi:hypothetical protein